MVTTFIGRMPSKTISENLEEIAKVWKPIMKYAEEKNVRIGIENCPMLFTEVEWPGGQKSNERHQVIGRKIFLLH